MRSWILIAYLIVFMVGISVVHADVPDENFESRLNEIFEQFNSQKLTEQEWMQVVGERQAESYEVQPGDTLWDLSRTFFGNGFFWPKLWQVNDSITNPHLIEPGYVIRFMPGTSADAPRVDIVATAAAPEAPIAQPEAAVPDVEEGQTFDEPPKFEAPIPKAAKHPLLKVLPPSLKAMVGGPESKVYDGFGISLEKEVVEVRKTFSIAPYILLDEEFEPIGRITTFQDGSTMGILNNAFEMEGESLPKGTRVVLYDDKGHLKDEVNGGTIGTLSKILGEGVVMGPSVSFESGNKIKIVAQVDSINIGASVMKGKAPRFPSQSRRVLKTGGHIVNKAIRDATAYLGVRTVAFVDIGAQQGVQAGDVIVVSKNPKVRDTKDRTIIGRARVIHVQSQYSTVLVEPFTDFGYIGDYVGGDDNASMKRIGSLLQMDSSLVKAKATSGQAEKAQEPDSDEFESDELDELE